MLEFTSWTILFVILSCFCLLSSSVAPLMTTWDAWNYEDFFKAFYSYNISIFLNQNYFLSASLKLLTTQPAQFSHHTLQQDHLHHPANHQLLLPQLTLRNDLLPISSRFLSHFSIHQLAMEMSKLMLTRQNPFTVFMETFFRVLNTPRDWIRQNITI